MANLAVLGQCKKLYFKPIFKLKESAQGSKKWRRPVVRKEKNGCKKQNYKYLLELCTFFQQFQKGVPFIMKNIQITNLCMLLLQFFIFYNGEFWAVVVRANVMMNVSVYMFFLILQLSTPLLLFYEFLPIKQRKKSIFSPYFWRFS